MVGPIPNPSPPLVEDQGAAFNQATLIVSVCNGILLFCGLLIAGVLSLSASDNLEKLNIVGLTAASCALFFSLAAGALAILGQMNAHNLHRRVVKDQTNPGHFTVDISRARKWGAWLTISANFAAITAAVCVAVMVGALISGHFSDTRLHTPNPDSSSHVVTVTTSEYSVQVDTKAAGRSVAIDESRPGCVRVNVDGETAVAVSGLGKASCDQAATAKAKAQMTKRATTNHARTSHRVHR